MRARPVSDERVPHGAAKRVWALIPSWGTLLLSVEAPGVGVPAEGRGLKDREVEPAELGRFCLDPDASSWASGAARANAMPAGRVVTDAGTPQDVTSATRLEACAISAMYVLE